MATMRGVLVVAVAKKWPLHKLHIKNAIYTEFSGRSIYDPTGRIPECLAVDDVTL
eukprot:c36151_g1_i1 orf=306-470(+)